MATESSSRYLRIRAVDGRFTILTKDTDGINQSSAAARRVCSIEQTRRGPRPRVVFQNGSNINQEIEMLRSVKSLEGFAIGATDGTIGKVKDFYFDDQSWVVRYLVVDTSAWLGGRRVLISPYSIGKTASDEAVLPATITKDQIKNSPGIDSEEPVSRQYEKSYLGYYGYPYYWGGAGLWGDGYYPGTTLTGVDAQYYAGDRGYLKVPSADDSDPHLRSCNAVKGYHLSATDGEIGHVEGFLVDDATWSIRYMIVNTSNWWVGHQVLVSPEWIEHVSWADSKVRVALTRESIKAAPVYTEGMRLDRDAEWGVYQHYGRKAYWRDARARDAA